MRLYFLRHGLAEDFAGSDYSRALTDRGQRRVAISAEVMQRLKIQPARIFSSPRLRARQTAEIVAATLKRPLDLAEAVDFGFDLSDIRALTKDLPGDAEVMFVGHNPDMSLLVHKLTGVNVSMKKGGLARVDLLSKRARQGELVWLIAPKVFDALQATDATASTPDQKLPASAQPLHSLIRKRWSPIGFDRERGIKRAALLSILEAGRWAASSYNMQPWRFIVAPRENAGEFQKILSALREGNQAWAQHAAVLMLAVTDKYGRDGRENRHAAHDLGLAIAQMVLQALDHDIYAHQMGGFFPDKARQIYQIPPQFEPYTAIAFGYRAPDLAHLNEGQRQREAAGRQRQALSEIVFNGSWAQAADFLD